MLAFFYLADTGILYRKYHQGKISKEEFVKTLKLNSL
jgi:hypothetical protein